MNDDVLAIQALIFRYAELVDCGDFDGLADLFSYGVFRTEGVPATLTGAGVREAMASTVVLYDGVPRTKHVSSNVVVEVDSGATAANARCYFTVFQALTDFPLQAVVAGRYHDRFEKVDGGWRFAERVIHIDLLGDTSRHLSISL